jgi:hypothetical protein
MALYMQKASSLPIGGKEAFFLSMLRNRLLLCSRMEKKQHRLSACVHERIAAALPASRDCF